MSQTFQDNLQSDRVKIAISEASSAYKLYLQNDNMNSDFAEFAALSFQDIKLALGRPEMTQQDVRRLLRRGYHSAKSLPVESCWITFMAGYLTQASNTN